MTESKAIKRLQTLNIILTDKAGHEEDGIEKIFTFSDITAICTAIQALEELEQYRAIGTVEEFAYAKRKVHIAELATEHIDKMEKTLKDYEAIGTIERFKELTENNGRIIEILRTNRFTDEECVEEIAKIVGICSKRLEHKGKSVGKWIFKNDGAYGKRRAYCSACGKRSGIGGIESNQKKPFCPNCGAEMQE